MSNRFPNIPYITNWHWLNALNGENEEVRKINEKRQKRRGNILQKVDAEEYSPWRKVACRSTGKG